MVQRTIAEVGQNFTKTAREAAWCSAAEASRA
jgi:hypothetical protein